MPFRATLTASFCESPYRLPHSSFWSTIALDVVIAPSLLLGGDTCTKPGGPTIRCLPPRLALSMCVVVSCALFEPAQLNCTHQGH